MIGRRHLARVEHLPPSFPGLAISDRRRKILECLKVDLSFVGLPSVTFDAVSPQKGLNSVRNAVAG